MCTAIREVGSVWGRVVERLILSVSILPVVATVDGAAVAVCCARGQVKKPCLGGIQFMRLDCEHVGDAAE